MTSIIRSTFTRFVFFAFLQVALVLTAFSIHAENKTAPLRALLITGGCCHDYETQKKTLSEGISARANVTWTILHEGGNSKTNEFSIYRKPNWTKDFDVIVHNECSGEVTNVVFIEEMAHAQTNGIGIVTIHCATHSYRMAKTDEWRKLLGVTSMRHQKKQPFTVVNVKPENPIMKGFPATWQNGPDELYEILKVWPDCIPLATSVTPGKPEDLHPSIWINHFGRSRVFGTTLGHSDDTMKTDVFLDVVTRGLLWTCDKLDENGKPKSGYDGSKQ